MSRRFFYYAVAFVGVDFYASPTIGIIPYDAMLMPRSIAMWRRFMIA